MQMLSPWGVESNNRDYSYSSWSISSYITEKLHMQLCSFLGSHCTNPGVCTSHTPQTTTLAPLVTHIPFSLGSETPNLQRSTPSVPLWSTLDTVPWDNLHRTEDIILAMSGLEIDWRTSPGITMRGYMWTSVSSSPSDAVVVPELSALAPGKPSRCDGFGFGDTGI